MLNESIGLFRVMWCITTYERQNLVRSSVTQKRSYLRLKLASYISEDYTCTRLLQLLLKK